MCQKNTLHHISDICNPGIPAVFEVLHFFYNAFPTLKKFALRSRRSSQAFCSGKITKDTAYLDFIYPFEPSTIIPSGIEVSVYLAK
ncbi:hypothetical protein RIF29_21857 [Crotalaria pallida]|uniref:Uncharacterized protein n=1 Tax=Crotalaria pallida TaxID=3830 RepID=A0AAN9IDU8_CROPI